MKVSKDFLCRLLGCQRRKGRRITLKVVGVTYSAKQTKGLMVELRSSVKKAAQVKLAPVDEDGNAVELDADAIVVTAPAGTRSLVMRLDEPGKPFLVTLVPGDTPAVYSFTVDGDLEPGEGKTVISEVFQYTATAEKAVTLGASVVGYVDKATVPPA